MIDLILNAAASAHESSWIDKLLHELIPNVIAYWNKFTESVTATFLMFFIAGIIAFALGLFIGVTLTVTEKGGLCENKVVFFILNLITNFFRSIPFLILLIFLIPFTRMIVGTSIGVKGAIVPLVFGCVPFFTRQVEAALHGVSPGKVEAARSMGTSSIGIIFRVYLHEAVPDLARATTITAISLLGLTTMAGAVGAGGIGSFAINYGQGLYHQDIVYVCVILLILITCILQWVGNFLAKRTTNRGLFNKTQTSDNGNEQSKES